MKQITLNLNETLMKLNEISNDQMDFVQLSFVDSITDQNEVFPAFINFYGKCKDGFYKDYASVDSIPLPEIV